MSNTISVLWWTDGEETVLARAYDDGERAQEDFTLVKLESGNGRSWTLTEIPFYRSFPELGKVSKTRTLKLREKKAKLETE